MKESIEKITMINLKIESTKAHEFLEYLLVTLLILEANSIYSQIYGVHLIIRTLIIILSTIITGCFIFNKKTELHKEVIKFIIYVFICSGFMFFNTSGLNGKVISLLLFAIYLPLNLIYLSNLSRENLKKLLKKFINVVIILCLVSLFFWILSAILNILKPTATIKAVWGKPYSTFETFFYLHFNTQDVWWITGSPLIRNTGIFTEGPMYAFVLITALIFNNLLCFENTKTNFIKTVILFVTMISTISVTGIICAVLIIGSNLNIYLSKKINSKMFFICASIILIICIIVAPFGFDMLNKKLQTGSATHRQLDIENGIKAFRESPIIGKGILHERPTEDDYKNGYGYSNTIIPVLSDGGTMLGVIYLLPIILLVCKCFKEDKENTKKYIVLGLIYMIILFTTLVQYRLMLIFLINIIYCLQLNINKINTHNIQPISEGIRINEK